MDRLLARYQNLSANNSLNKSASVKALSNLKNQSVDKQDTLKPIDLNIFRNNGESKKSGHNVILLNIIFYCCRLLIIISFRKMTIKNTENMINESLNNILVPFIRETHTDIFINNKIFTILNITTYF